MSVYGIDFFNMFFMFVKHQILAIWWSVCRCEFRGLCISQNTCIQWILEQSERHVFITPSVFIRISSDLFSEYSCYWSSINQWQSQRCHIQGKFGLRMTMTPAKCIKLKVSTRAKIFVRLNKSVTLYLFNI